MRGPRIAGLLAATAALLAAGAMPAAAQPALPGLGGAGAGPRIDRNAPVTFSANEVEYNQDTGVVTARGNVEAWQGERILRADEFTYDRSTGVATARGNVQLLEPDGQVLFAESVELTSEFKEGVLNGLRGLLAGNARVAAAGARRTGGVLTDLARVVYSPCAPCAENPLAPPLWQLRARVATWDQRARQIRYRDASLQIAGVPVLYTPYFAHPDGTAERQSGFLSPAFGYTRYLGAFVSTPYYWAIDPTQDLTITPTFSTQQFPNLSLEYRRRFNSGEIEAEASIGSLRDVAGFSETDSWGWHLFSRGRFAINENWRAGFDINRTSSELYLRTWRYGARRVLPSEVFAEGFWGTDAYARVDARVYQGLRATDDAGLIPTVLPNIYYEYAPPPDALGGYLTLDTWNYAIFRDDGTDTRRLAGRLRYELPRTDRFGSVWTFRTQVDALGYWYEDLNRPPTSAFGADGGTLARANVRAALDWRLPLVRDAGAWGSQLIEPRVQIVTGPDTGLQRRIPNEDSLDFEFTDANLFALNRWTGRDRLEGGSRVDAALRGAWYFPNGGQIEGLIGRSYRLTGDSSFDVGTGLENRASDWVARARIAPVPWFEVLGRTRLDGESFERRLTDVTATVTLGRTSYSAGYLYTSPSPYLVPTRTREEVSVGFNTRIGDNWRVGAVARYDIDINRPVLYAATAAYEDECFLVEGRFVRNYAEDPVTARLYPSGTVLLLRVAFKTVGDFGFRAI